MEADRWAIIVAGGSLQIPCVEAAHSLGLKVIVTDRNAAAAAVHLADDFYPIDTYDHQRHRDLVRWLIDKKGRQIIGCWTAGADVAPTVSACAEEAGTPGIPFAVAQRTHSKLDVRRTLRQYNKEHGWSMGKWRDPVQPDWFFLHRVTPHDPYFIQSIAQFMDRHGGAAVLKPTNKSASRGVSIIYEKDMILGALIKAIPFLNERRELLVEECLTGSEHSAEIIRDETGQVIFFNVVDRPFRYDGGIPLELGHVNPSRRSPEQKSAIQELLIKAADALGVTWGAFKADVMVTHDGPKILEVTARLSGGWDSAATTGLSSGRNPIRVVCCLACNLPTIPEDLNADKGRYAACAAAFPRPGKVVTVRHMPRWPEFRAMGVEKLVLTVQPGQVIEPYEHCAQRPAFCIATADTYDEAWERATQAAKIVEDAIVTSQ